MRIITLAAIAALALTGAACNKASHDQRAANSAGGAGQDAAAAAAADASNVTSIPGMTTDSATNAAVANAQAH
jgi:hypothetical protein